MKVLKHNEYHSNGRVVTSGKHSFVLIKHEEEINFTSISTNDGIIVDAEHSGHFVAIVFKIRSHNDPSIFLKPIFITQALKGSEIEEMHCDGYSDMLHLSEIELKANAIIKRIKAIAVYHTAPNYDLNVLLKTLQFHYTRNKSIQPQSNRYSKIGYLFSFISLFYKEGEERKILDVLVKAEKKGYLSGSVQDKLHLCKPCNSSYLHFRETCPKCTSIDLKTEDMIHHFVCATIAPESDFTKGEDLCCPKCNKHLRHIGIDYDKPSSIHTCNTCNERFQNSQMKAFCVDCHHVNDLTDLEEKRINAYTLTAKGEQIALTGFAKKVTNENQEYALGTVNKQFFHLLLKQESVRVDSKNIYSAIGKIEISGENILGLNNATKEILKNELIQNVKGYLNPEDVLNVEDYRSLYFIMPDCNEKIATEKTDLIQFNLHKLLNHNLPGSAIHVEVNTLRIHPNFNLEDLNTTE